MRFTPTEEQQKIIDSILENPSGISVLMGAAGTGKTTVSTYLVEELLSALNGTMGLVIAPTVTAVANFQKRFGGASDKRLKFKTTASLLRNAVQYLTIGDLSFGLEDSDLERLQKYLSLVLKIKNTGDIIKQRERFNRRLKRNETINEIDEIQLNDALNERFGIGTPTRERFSHKLETRFELAPAPVVASMLANMEVSFIILDEATMLPMEDMSVLVEALEELPYIKLIICGDPSQLPPVEGAPNPYMVESRAKSGEPGFYVLNTVLRSTDDILEIAKPLRFGATFDILAKKFSAITPLSSIDELLKNYTEELTEANTVLAFRNADVKSINEYVRFARNKTGSVQAGDKIVCTQNFIGLDDSYEFFNAEQFEVLEVKSGESAWKLFTIQLGKQLTAISNKSYTSIDAAFNVKKSIVYAKVRSLATGEEKECFMNSLHTFAPTSVQNEIMKLVTNSIVESDPVGNLHIPYVKMQFGYAITVHKAQGSEWDSVIYLARENDRYITKGPALEYTAVTRARSKLRVFYLN